MIGAIAGDIIGSVYEWNNIKTGYTPRAHSNTRSITAPTKSRIPGSHLRIGLEIVDRHCFAHCGARSGGNF